MDLRQIKTFGRSTWPDDLAIPRHDKASCKSRIRSIEVTKASSNTRLPDDQLRRKKVRILEVLIFFHGDFRQNQS